MAKPLKPEDRAIITGKYSKSFYLCPKCKTPLWELLNNNIAKILGANGQDFEIGFTYLKAKCKKCSTLSLRRSEIAEMIMDASEEISKETLWHTTSITLVANPYAVMSSFDKKKLLNTLSENQKMIFRVLEKMPRIQINDDFIETIGDRIESPLSEKVIRKSLEIIQSEATKLNLYNERIIVKTEINRERGS